MFPLLLSLADLRASFAAWSDTLIARLPALAIAIVVFLVFILFAALARSAAARSLAHVTRDKRAGDAWGSIVRYIVLLLGVVAALATAGVDLGAMMVAVGALAFGLAFGMQEIIANMVSGLILLSTHPFAAGDAVEVGGVQGKVEEVGMRATKVRTWDGLRVEVPNRSVLGSPITVFSYHRDRRFEVLVGVGYDDDIPGAVRAAQRAVASIDGVLEDPAPEVFVDALGASSVDLKVRFWVDTKAGRPWVEVKADVTRKVKEALDAGGYDIPYPVRTLYVHEAGNGSS